MIRASRLSEVSSDKTLFYQLVVSAPVLFIAAWLLGEPGITNLTPLFVASFAYQCIVVT